MAYFCLASQKRLRGEMWNGAMWLQMKVVWNQSYFFNCTWDVRWCTPRTLLFLYLASMCHKFYFHHVRTEGKTCRTRNEGFRFWDFFEEWAWKWGIPKYVLFGTLLFFGSAAALGTFSDHFLKSGNCGCGVNFILKYTRLSLNKMGKPLR